MNHGFASKNEGVVLKSATSPQATKHLGGRRPRGETSTSRQPIRTVKIIRKVEGGSSLQETGTELQLGADFNLDGEAKTKSFFLIVKTDDNNNVPRTEREAKDAPHKRPKLAVESSLVSLRPPGKGQLVKVRKEALQSLPELRELINFHRSKHAELIQENQLYDSQLGIQDLSLPISPISTGNAFAEDKSRCKQPPKAPRRNSFKAADRQVVVPARRGQFRPKVILPKDQPGQLFAFNRQEAQLRIPEVWPVQQNLFSQHCLTHIRPAAHKSAVSTLTAGMSFTSSATKENIPLVTSVRDEPTPIIYPDEYQTQCYLSKSPVCEANLSSLLGYHDVTILSDDFRQDNAPIDRNENDSRAKRVLEEFDLLNSPDACFDPIENEYVPNNPDFDFRSLDVEIRREAVGERETVQSFQEPFVDEILEVLRSEVFDPFQLPLMTTAHPAHAHGSKDTNVPKNEKSSPSGSVALRWKCKLCLEKHATKNSLITHLKKHQQPFCSICLTVTSSDKKLRTHTLKAHPSNDRQELLSLDGVIVTSKYGRRRAILDAATLCGRKRVKPCDSV